MNASGASRTLTDHVWSKNSLLYAALIVAILSLTACADEKARPHEPVARVTATALVQEYDRDEVAATARYDNQWIDVSGTITRIGVDVVNTPYVRLDGEIGAAAVEARFRRFDGRRPRGRAYRDIALLRRFSTGQFVTLNCRVRTYGLRDVLVDNCAVR